MAGAPIKITLYGEENEVVGEYTRLFVPWKLLKACVRISKTLNLDNISEEDVDAIAALVCDVFGNKFTVKELNDGADVTEMIAVLNAVVTRTGISGGIMGGNPT